MFPRCLHVWRSAVSKASTRQLSVAASSSPPRILKSDVQDILFNFSVEQYLMECGKVEAPLLYLWRPSPVVTIGRHQNPWKECVLSALEKDGVTLARRRSGGGAVFQDLGCTVFTFIAPLEQFSIDRNFDVVLGALRRIGINVERSGRNDMTFEGRKMSGSAFKSSPHLGVSLHHGTILIDTDFTALQRYLTPDKRKLEAKGIASVGARVVNLKERFQNLNHDLVCESLISEFKDAWSASNSPTENVYESSGIALEEPFRRIYDEIADDKWRFGSTPEFSHQLETRIDGVGVFDVRMQLVGGKVEEVVIFSDALFPDVIDRIMEVITGVHYGRHGLRTALQPLQAEFPEGGPRRLIDEFMEWLTANVDD